MTASELRTVVVEREIASPAEKIWRALTQPHLIEEWLMTNDFKPVPGHKFNLRRDPTPEVSVVIDCEVLDVDPNRTLSYKWQAFGVDTVVTFTLTPTPTGTILRVEQAGFRLDQKAAYKGSRASWPHFLAALDDLLKRTDGQNTRKEPIMATANKPAKTPAKTSATKTTTTKVFSDAEMEAMQDAKKERKKGNKADGEADLRAAIAKLSGSDRALTEKLHEIVMTNAPSLTPKTWYGLPAWANAEGKAVVFFTPASKFKDRYGSLGFQSSAKLDDGNMWPTSFAIMKLGEAEANKIAALVKKAVG